jgi:hypothetical protein
MSTQITEWLDVVAKILLRCWIFGFLLLTIWFGFFMLAPDVIYSLHGSMFDLSPHELNIIQYSALAFVKLVVICFFFFPWLAIRMVLKEAKD